MKPETAEWVDKAEGDWKVANREMQSADPVWNVVCFLAQQCAEKYVKALSEERGIAFRRMHDLVVLLDRGGDEFSELESMRDRLAYLGTFGIAARYPGAQADRPAAENALETAEKVRGVVKAKLGLA